MSSEDKELLKKIVDGESRQSTGRYGLDKKQKQFSLKMKAIAKVVIAWSEQYSERQMSDNTVGQVKRAIEMFIRYLDYFNIGLKGINRKTYKRFCDLLAMSTYSASTKKVTFVYVKLFMRYLFDVKGVKSFDLDSNNVKMSTRRSRKRTQLVPRYDDFLSLRQLELAIERALFFEMSVTSGVRVSELLQVRYCDITPGDVPYDVTTGKKTIYAGGSISLNRAIHSIKNDTSRKTYYSKLSSRLLTLYMKINNLENLDSRAPIFPWTKSAIDHWIEYVNKEMSFITANSIKHTNTENTENTMSPEEFGSMSPDMAKLVSRRLKDSRKKKRRIGKSDVTEAENQKMRFNIHSLRHLFAAIQIFRDYRGGTGDLEYVRQLLGHTSQTMDTTLRYVSKVDLIKTKKQWDRIMIGVPGDWCRMIITPVSMKLLGIKKRRASEA